MRLLDEMRHAGGWRRLLRWRLWNLNLARCPYCRGMDRAEWDAMCDCFIPHDRWRR